MAYSATLTPSGTYYVTNNGVGVATTSQSGLAQYGLSPTNLTAPVAGTPVSNSAATIGTGGASIAYGATNSPNSSVSGGYQFTPTSTGIQVTNNGQNMGTMSAAQAANLGYSNPIPSSLYTLVQTAVKNGTMSPSQAVTYLQGMIGSTYTGSVNTGTLFPAGFTYTSSGQQYQIGQAGAYQNPVKTTATVNISTPQGSGTAAAAGGTTAGAITVNPTGNPQLDQILQGITGVANNLVSQGYTIPADLQITPALVSDFLGYAHQAIDPYTKQLLDSEISNVNANLSQMGTNFNNTQAETEQQFGTDLATEQNTAGGNGTAFSGQRNVDELNMAASANRNLSSNAATAGYNIGNAARTAAANVGSANAGGIVLPSLATGSVSLSGGQRGSTSAGSGLSYNYDPSLYTVGTIPSNQAAAVNQQQQNYISQYGTLAGAQSNSGRSMSDLVGMVSGLPDNYSAPTNLQ